MHAPLGAPIRTADRRVARAHTHQHDLPTAISLARAHAPSVWLLCHGPQEHGDHTAFVSERVAASDLERASIREVLLRSTLAAAALREDLMLPSSARLAIYLPNTLQVHGTPNVRGQT